jgi:hypothetical protein
MITQPKPISDSLIIKILLGVIIVLAFLAGYYHSLWSNNLKYQTSSQQSGVVFLAKLV